MKYKSVGVDSKLFKRYLVRDMLINSLERNLSFCDTKYVSFYFQKSAEKVDPTGGIYPIEREMCVYTYIRNAYNPKGEQLSQQPKA